MKLFVGIALVLAVFSVNAQTKLRYAHVGVANAPQTLYADEVAKLVKERTNGRVEIQVFANSQLGGVNEMVDGVRSGAISDRRTTTSARSAASWPTPRCSTRRSCTAIPSTRCAPPTRRCRRRCARSTRSWCRRATCASSPRCSRARASSPPRTRCCRSRTCRARSTAACRSSCGPRCSPAWARSPRRWRCPSSPPRSPPAWWSARRTRCPTSTTSSCMKCRST